MPFPLPIKENSGGDDNLGDGLAKNKFCTDKLGLLTRFRRASDGEVIRGPKRGFFLVHFPRWLFFQLILNLFFPIQ
jgi:hypothetical protein